MANETIIQVNVTNASTKSISLGQMTGEDIIIDWGDGTQITDYDGSSVSKIYDNLGQYTITISGNVTSIHQFCFSSASITSVILSDTITSIKDMCCYHCVNLSFIQLSQNIQTIGGWFLSGTSIEHLELPSTVTEIGARLCSGCSRLQTFTSYGIVTKVGTYFLDGCSSLINFDMPNATLANCGNYFMQGCSSLKKVIHPLNSSSIMYAYQDCISLEEIVFDKNFSYIGSTCFTNCPNLKQITIKSTNNITTLVDFTTFDNIRFVIKREKLDYYLNHSKFPNDEKQYSFYGDSIAEKIYILGEELARKLTDKDIPSEPNEGLTTLANKIHDIDSTNYKELAYNLAWNDNNNEYGFRPSQFPTLLLANNEVIGGCLLPQDDMTNIDQKISSQEIYDLTNIQVSANNCGTFAELQAIIDEADDGDTITLEKDYKNAGDEEPLEIYNKSLHIIGNGHILDANNVTIVMENGWADESVLEDIYFINGNGAEDYWNGGAFCGWGETLINCVFINNNGYIGGACRMGDEAIVSNCLFINNISFADEYDDDDYLYGGGALAIEDTPVTISECTFINNIAKHGGGIFFDYSEYHGPKSIDVYDCIFDDVSTLYHVNNVQSKYSYATQVPESDLNGEEITYTWEPLMSHSAYTKQDTSSQDIHTTTMQIKNRRRLIIEPMYQSGESAIDAIIDICGQVTNNDDNSERTIQFSDFKLENNKYVIDFFTTSRVQYSLTLKAIDGYVLSPTKITGASVISNAEYEEQYKNPIVVMESAPIPIIDDDAIDDS